MESIALNKYTALHAGHILGLRQRLLESGGSHVEPLERERQREFTRRHGFLALAAFADAAARSHGVFMNREFAGVRVERKHSFRRPALAGCDWQRS